MYKNKNKIQIKNTDSSQDMVTFTRNVIESYIFATGHQNLSIYSERLLIILAKVAQAQLAGVNFKSKSSMAQVTIGTLGNAEVKIDAKKLLNCKTSKNYEQVKKAVMELLNTSVSHERPLLKHGKPVLNSKGKPIYQFEAHNLLNNININSCPGYIVVDVNKVTWQALLDFSKGFRKYDLQAAMKLSGTYSLRMLKLISNQKQSMTFSINELREQWELTNKYNKPTDFIKRTIKSAKKELDAISPWTFEYELIYDNDNNDPKRPGPKVAQKIAIYPVHQLKYESTSAVIELAHKPTDMLGAELNKILTETLGFDKKEIKANLTLLKTAMDKINLKSLLISITPKALEAKNPQGYVINAIKKKLKISGQDDTSDNSSNKQRKSKSKQTATSQQEDLAELIGSLFDLND